VLESLSKFISSLTNALPKLYQLYKDGKHEEKIIELMECYFVLGGLIETADELLLLAKDRESIVFSELSTVELKQQYSIVQSKLTIQLQRLQRIGDIFLSNPTIELLDPEIKSRLKSAIGGKEKGLYSLGAGLFFNQIFGSARKSDESDDEHVLRVVKEKYEFANSILRTSSISVSEQKDIVCELKNLRKQYGGLLNDLTDSKEKTLLSSKAKEFAEKYDVRE